jgi:hypothetical protein
MEFHVKTPSKSFNGKRAGIFFRNGEATFTEERLVEVFETMGFEVIKPEKPKVKKAAAKKKKRDE